MSRESLRARDCLVIFDCDGVLVDSERLTVKVEAELLCELGWQISEAEVVERFVGRSDLYMFAEIEEHLGRPVPEWSDLYRTRQRKVFESELHAVEGVSEAIREIDSTGYLSCVASSGTHEKMAFTLGLSGLWDFFAGRIFSATEVENGKPAPDLFLHAAQQMQVSVGRCVVIEDSPAGVSAAKAAGMGCVGFANNLVPADRLGSADIVIDSMEDLPDAVRSIFGPRVPDR